MGRNRIEIDISELKQLADNGMTIKQLAEHFNCSERVINRRRRDAGVQYGRGHSPANKKANHSRAGVRFGEGVPLKIREADFVKRLASDRRTQMYEYIEGYKSKYDKLIVRCRNCGELKETTPQQLFHSKYDHHVCFNCIRIENERAESERKAEIARREAEELAKDKICPICGNVFHSPYESHTYCSNKCKRKARDHSHRKRALKFGVEYDPTITWQSLSEKLGHCNCEICGEPCDPTDTSWGNSYGSSYPTVDCIVPMSKGGSYTWDNVQLAHAICNSAKRDLIDDEEIEKAVSQCAIDDGSNAQRHAAGTTQDACTCAGRLNRPRRRVTQHGTAGTSVPRDDTRDCRAR